MFSVFISSTNLDLEEYRKEAAMAAHAAAFNADLQENWTAEDHPPLEACLERVRRADLLVVIVAHRYGWVPEEAGRNPEGKSITWLECEEAEANGKEVLAFVVDEDADWPRTMREEAALDRAAHLDDDEAADALIKATRGCIRGLKAFKQWLGSRGLRRTFHGKQDLKLEVERALKEWRSRQTDRGTGAGTGEAGPPPVPFTYLAWLRRECESVELLGLEAQELHPTRLSHVYVPALTPARQPAETERFAREKRPRFDLLLGRLGEESLYAPGDPGAGKSTFCRWLALVAASEAPPVHPIPDPETYREGYPEGLRDRLPVLVLCLPDNLGCRAPQMRSGKAPSAGHGHPWSRTATPHERIWGAPFGRAGKGASTALRLLARTRHCPRGAPCSCPLPGPLHPKLSGRQSTSPATRVLALPAPGTGRSAAGPRGPGRRPGRLAGGAGRRPLHPRRDLRRPAGRGPRPVDPGRRR